MFEPAGFVVEFPVTVELFRNSRPVLLMPPPRPSTFSLPFVIVSDVRVRLTLLLVITLDPESSAPFTVAGPVTVTSLLRKVRPPGGLARLRLTTGLTPSAGSKPIWFSKGDPDVGQSAVPTVVLVLEAPMASRREHWPSGVIGTRGSAVVLTVTRIPAIAPAAKSSDTNIANSPAISNLILIEPLSPASSAV